MADRDYYQWREAQALNGTILKRGRVQFTGNFIPRGKFKGKVKGDPIECRCGCKETFPFNPKIPGVEFKSLGHKEKYWQEVRHKKYLEKKQNGV